MHEDWTTKRKKASGTGMEQPEWTPGPPRLFSLWHVRHPFGGGWSLSRKQLHMNLHEPLPFPPPNAECSGSKERNIPLKNSAPARPRHDRNSELCSHWAHGRRRLISDEKHLSDPKAALPRVLIERKNNRTINVDWGERAAIVVACCEVAGPRARPALRAAQRVPWPPRRECSPPADAAHESTPTESET